MSKKRRETVRLDRRSALMATGAGFAGAALSANPSRATDTSLDLSDPAVGLEAFVKLRGSTAAETVYQVYSGNIFQAVNGEVPRPIIGFWGLQKTLWRPDGEGGYYSMDYDLGLYVDQESREVLETWDNHLTGESNEVMHYRSGPSEGHATLKGEDVRRERYTDLWQTTGDSVTHESTTARERTNLLQPEDYPLGSTGPRFLTSTSYTMFGRTSELADSSATKVPCSYVWSFIAPWPPWMEMGQRDDFVVWRWVGHKVMQETDISADLIAAVENVWPGYTTDDRPWEEPSSGWNQYKWKMDGHTPT